MIHSAESDYGSTPDKRRHIDFTSSCHEHIWSYSRYTRVVRQPWSVLFLRFIQCQRLHLLHFSVPACLWMNGNKDAVNAFKHLPFFSLFLYAKCSLFLRVVPIYLISITFISYNGFLTTDWLVWLQCHIWYYTSLSLNSTSFCHGSWSWGWLRTLSCTRL